MGLALARTLLLQEITGQKTKQKKYHQQEKGDTKSKEERRVPQDSRTQPPPPPHPQEMRHQPSACRKIKTVPLLSSHQWNSKRKSKKKEQSGREETKTRSSLAKKIDEEVQGNQNSGSIHQQAGS